MRTLLLTTTTTIPADTDDRASGAMQSHFHDAALFAQHHLQDPCPDVRVGACRLLTEVAQLPAYEVR